MIQRRFLTWFVCLLVVILLVVCMLPGAQAAPLPQVDVRAFSGGSPLIVPAAAFTSDGNTPDSTFFWFSGGYMQGTATDFGCVQAPVYFPQPAMMVDLFVSVYDNDPDLGLSVMLERVNNYTGTTSVLAKVSTSTYDASSSIQVLNDDTIDYPMVDYPQYAYYLTTCLRNENMRLYSVRIYYQTFDIFLPLVLMNYP